MAETQTCAQCGRLISEEFVADRNAWVAEGHAPVAYVTVEHTVFGCDMGRCGHVVYACDRRGNEVCRSDFNSLHPALCNEDCTHRRGDGACSQHDEPKNWAKDFAAGHFPNVPLRWEESSVLRH